MGAGRPERDDPSGVASAGFVENALELANLIPAVDIRGPIVALDPKLAVSGGQARKRHDLGGVMANHELVSITIQLPESSRGRNEMAMKSS